MNKYAHFSRLKSSSSSTFLKDKKLDLPQVIKRVSSRLSTLSHRENIRVSQRTQSLLSLSNSHLSLPNTARSPGLNMPSQENLDKLISDLDLISKPKKPKQEPMVALEAKPRTVILFEGQSEYFTLQTRGKRTPLVINMTHACGKTKVFVSKTFKLPNDITCDSQHIESPIVVNEDGIIFKTNEIHLGILALEHTKFLIEISYGKVFLEQKIKEKRSKLKVSPSKTARINSKNFVEINKNYSPVDHQRRLETWSKKRKEAMSRRSLFMFKKREKTLSILNKKILKAELEKEEEERRQVHRDQINRQREWLKLLLFVKYLRFFEEVRCNNREALIDYLKNSYIARKFQNKFRQANPFTLRETVLLKASKNLKLYASNAHIQLHVTQFIRDTGNNCALAYAIDTIAAAVVVIENAWKKYSAQTKSQLTNVILLWNQTLSRLQDKKVLRKRTRTFVQIPQETRNKVIIDYLQTRKRELRHHIQIDPKRVPKLDYIPDEKTVNSLIRRARTLR